VVVGIIVVRPVIALLATIVGEDGVAGVAVAKRFPEVSLGGGENASTGRDAAQRDQIVQKVNTPALGFMRI